MTNEIGKIPPQSVELEEAVLGAILLESRSIYLASKLIQPFHFYKQAHQLICKSCFELYNDSKPVDILTVTQHLKESKKLEWVGGAYYISQLTNSVASTANLEYHCRIVVQKYLQREVIRLSSEGITRMYEGKEDVFNEIQNLQTNLHGLVKNLSDKNDIEIDKVAEQLNELVEGNLKGNTPGIPTGVTKYDKYSGGQQRGNLIIYAGRPGMGKSARMINEVYAQLKMGYSVVIHSLEMTRIEIAARLIGLHIKIPPSDIMRKKIDQKKWQEGKKWLAKQKFKIYIGTSLIDIERETALMVTEKKCDIIYIDYLQLIDAGERKTIDNVSKASMSMKQLAKKMDIPVVCLAQLSRAVETRGGDKKPMLSDLRESGQIEQDADVVEFLYRPEYYGFENDEEGNSLVGKMFFINGKLRGGQPNMTIDLEWDGPLNRIYEKKEEITPDNPFAGIPQGNENIPF